MGAGVTDMSLQHTQFGVIFFVFYYNKVLSQLFFSFLFFFTVNIGGSFGIVKKENSQMDIASALRGFLFNGNDDDNEIGKTIPPPVKGHVTMF